jgi:hypothetical protein
MVDLVVDRERCQLLGISHDCSFGRSLELARAVPFAEGTVNGGGRYLIRDRYFLPGGIEVDANGNGKTWPWAEVLWHDPGGDFPETQHECAQILVAGYWWLYRQGTRQESHGAVGVVLNYVDEVLADHDLVLPPLVGDVHDVTGARPGPDQPADWGLVFGD